MDSRTPKMEAGAAQAVQDTPVVRDPPPIRDTPPVRDTPVKTLRERPPAEDPFRLGWRYRAGTNKDGREDVLQVPLGPEDLLNPQEGDVLSDGFPHSTFLLSLADAMRRHLHKRPGLLVTCGVVLVLEDGTNCAPDIAVIEGHIDTSEIERAINLRAVGGRLVFALEAVSTSEKEIENKDIEKNVKRYAAHRVPEYLTVYPVADREVKNLVGRRLAKKGDGYRGKYGKISPDASARVYSEKLDLNFVIDRVSRELVAYDATTGQRLLTSEEEEAGRVQAEHRLAKEAKARREEAEARREAERGRLKAEQLNREMMAELEQLRAQLSGPTSH